MLNDTISDKIAEYYNYAVIHIAWIVKRNKIGNGSERYLVFGLVECYPKELEKPLTICEQGNKFKGGRLYYIRIIKPVKTAIEWYRSIKQNGFITIDWEEQGQENNCREGSSTSKWISCGRMRDVKEWPKLLLSKKDENDNIPFLADIWNVVRTHQLFPEERQAFLMDFIMHDKIGMWLEKYLTWNISYYPELIGSINLVLPNPFYSSRHIHMIPGNGESDQVKIEFQARNGFSLEGLRVIPFEKNYFGLTGGDEYPIKNDFCNITLSGKAEKFGMYVVDSQKNIIDYTDFAGFIQGFVVDIFTGYATKEIHRSKTGKKPAKIDYVEVFEKNGMIKDGHALEDNEDAIGERLEKAEIFRKRKKDMEKAGGQFFYQNHEEAESFIRKLINKAHKSVVIVDPYFGTDELFDYVMAVSVRNINIEIIASKTHLRKKSKGVYSETNDSLVPTIGEELRSQIEGRNDGVNGMITAYVMTGSNPAVHDRFLIIDDEAWFCGGSLNEIGNRLSCMIRLPDSLELVQLLDRIKSSNQVRLLNNWLDSRVEENELIGTEEESDSEEDSNIKVDEAID